MRIFSSLADKFRLAVLVNAMLPVHICIFRFATVRNTWQTKQKPRKYALHAAPPKARRQRQLKASPEDKSSNCHQVLFKWKCLRF